MRICDKCIHDKVCLLSKSRANCELFDEKRPYGEWIVSMANTRCSNCGYNGKTVEETNFCPNCGAQMAEKTCDNCLLSEGEQCDILVPSENCKYWKPKLKEGDEK